MGLIESLSARPLTRAELATLNDADAVDLAAPVSEADANDRRPDAAVDGVLLATDAWVQAVVLEDDSWDAVARVNLDGTDRFDALRACEFEALDALSRAGDPIAPDGGDGDS